MEQEKIEQIRQITEEAVEDLIAFFEKHKQPLDEETRSMAGLKIDHQVKKIIKDREYFG